ncbi:MAG: hypothetical protein K2X77_06900 [Candidatus Obscuribacterales bacterium]|nr:hypothetical protein [Candidatus Obscuribacterales bacterium]
MHDVGAIRFYFWIVVLAFALAWAHKNVAAGRLVDGVRAEDINKQKESVKPERPRVRDERQRPETRKDEPKMNGYEKPIRQRR